MTRSAETKVLLARITLWALTHNCKGLWEIGTFYCFCSNHLFICLPFSPSCPYSPLFFFVSHPFHLPSFLPFNVFLSLPVLLVSLPSFIPYLNYFPFLCLPLFPSSVSLTSSSSPSSLASYLNCSAHWRTQSGRAAPCRPYCQHQFYCKE